MKNNLKIRIPQALLMVLAVTMLAMVIWHLFYAVGYLNNANPAPYPVGSIIDYAIFLTSVFVTFGAAGGVVILGAMNYRQEKLISDAVLIAINTVIAFSSVVFLILVYVL